MHRDSKSTIREFKQYGIKRRLNGQAEIYGTGVECVALYKTKTRSMASALFFQRKCKTGGQYIIFVLTTYIGKLKNNASSPKKAKFLDFRSCAAYQWTLDPFTPPTTGHSIVLKLNGPHPCTRGYLIVIYKEWAVLSAAFLASLANQIRV